MQLRVSELSRTLQDFVTVCEVSIGSVLSQTMGEKWNAAASDERPKDEIREQLSFSFALTKGLVGRFRISLEPPDAIHLVAGFIGGDPSTCGTWDESHREALMELLRQVGGEIASQLGKSYGEVGIELENRELPAEESQIRIATKSTTGTEIPIYLCISRQLQELMEARSPSVVPLSAEGPRQENLELLMGVELRATLRFGQRRMLLRELLNLNAGSIIELDRHVQEPVDLLVDGKVIAKGEVVILDGNYGMRITSVASPNSRAGCLI